LSRHCVEQAASGVFYISLVSTASQYVCGEVTYRTAFPSGMGSFNLFPDIPYLVPLRKEFLTNASTRKTQWRL
jgi:hypothetical protein